MIVVTTPTGTIGHQVVENVLASNEAVRVIVRDPSTLSDSVRERVDVVAGSHGDADVVEAAFADADAVFWLVPPDPTADSVDAAYVGFTRPAANAFARSDVKRVVGITALGRGTPMASSAGFATATLAMDDLIASSGVSYRALTMPSFMDNIARQSAPIRARTSSGRHSNRDRRAEPAGAVTVSVRPRRANCLCGTRCPHPVRPAARRRRHGRRRCSGR